MGNILVGGLLIAAIAWAVRSVKKSGGGCDSCAGCSGQCHKG
ncbi:hypothetical protein QO008_001325 [Peptoniphilus ivorii]|nr:FeoB-associated Cys-rich membrane protein [Peptoniphilus ivorii]MDQ0508864.1 hypothetical protein [Peptoniphilus ivorii]